MLSNRQPIGAESVPRIWRAVAVTALAGLLLGAPSIARAAFSSEARGSTAVSTLTLVTPVGATVTASCLALTLDVRVTNYGTVPGATSYEFILRDPSGATVKTSNGSYFQILAARGTWTYQVRGIYTAAPGNVWTGVPYQGTVTC